MSCGGPAGTAAAVESPEGVADCEQPAKSRSATAAAPAVHVWNPNLNVRVLLNMEASTDCRGELYASGRCLYMCPASQMARMGRGVCGTTVSTRSGGATPRR